ncbi:hypothetical protein WR25_24686 [Diploscapter pachys]|uniref:Uncharacterized protein n=1 Tax=Diploscapter pachys TaxID=2018661 RepID=A0A2A2L5H7_9BILA|nr:hypothetical protein WR25_24686 [Diploscapter pachys]
MEIQAYRFVAYSAVTFSVVAVLAVCVTLPMGSAKDIWSEVNHLKSEAANNRTARHSGYGGCEACCTGGQAGPAGAPGEPQDNPEDHPAVSAHSTLLSHASHAQPDPQEPQDPTDPQETTVPQEAQGSPRVSSQSYSAWSGPEKSPQFCRNPGAPGNDAGDAGVTPGAPGPQGPPDPRDPQEAQEPQDPTEIQDSQVRILDHFLLPMGYHSARYTVSWAYQNIPEILAKIGDFKPV